MISLEISYTLDMIAARVWIRPNKSHVRRILVNEIFLFKETP